MMEEMTVMDELSVFLAAAIGFGDLTGGEDFRDERPMSEWERRKYSRFDAIRNKTAFKVFGGYSPLAFAKYVLPMYLHDAIGAGNYVCYEDIRAVSFNFPERNGANNCVIAEYDPGEGLKSDRLMFIVEFSNVRMLDDRHVDKGSVKVLAQYRAGLDGILPAIEEFTGLRIPKCATIGDWNPAYRGWFEGFANPDAAASDRYSRICEEIKAHFEGIEWQLYPAPGFTIKDEQRKLKDIEEKKRKQMAHIQAITGRA